MAQTQLSGFTVVADKAEASDDKPATPEEELAAAVISRLRTGFPKAAMAAAVELVNSIAVTHDLGGGAYL